MYKRGLAFLLAAVLAFSPAMQVNAAEVTTQEIPEETPEVEMMQEVSETPDAQETEMPEATPEESVVPEDTQVPFPEVMPTQEPEVTPSMEPEETPVADEVPEVSAEPEESLPSEETPSTNPEESAIPAESIMPEESPSADPEESVILKEATSPEPTPEATPEAELEIDTELVTLLTEDITITNATENTSGEGWTWVASTKTFTMDGYHSTGELTLPDGATLVLAEGSENTIDTSEKYRSIDAQGDLTVKGSGKLTVKYASGGGIAVRGEVIFQETNVHFLNEADNFVGAFFDGGGNVRIVCSNVRIEMARDSYISKSLLSCEGCTFTGGKLEVDYYNYRYNEETGLYEMFFEKSPIYVTTQPVRINKLYVGESVELKTAAKSMTGAPLTYQWYSTENFDNPDNGATKVKDATGKTLTVKPKTRGITYYFCKVTSKSTSFNTDVAAIVVSDNAGMKICTEKPSFSATVDKMATDGWKYDMSTHTLTLENMDLLVPFPTNYTNIQIKSGYNVVINGTNYIDDNDGCISITNANQVGKITTFSGTGSLYTNDIDCYYLDSDAEVHYTGDITLYLTEFDPDKGTSVLDGATIKSERDNDIKGPLILQNGASFDAAADMEVMGDITVGEGCTLVSGSWVICNGSLTIGKDATVIVDSSLNMDYTLGVGVNKSRELRIDGTLYVKANGTSQPFFFYSEAEKPLVLGDGVNVITPEGAVWEKKSTSGYNWAFTSGGTSNIGALMIGKQAVETKEITRSKEVTGTAKYGSVLTAGEVSPADATVSYQWQYAETASGPWSNIYGERAKTYVVSTQYAGYYLRVITKGIGTYTGEIASESVGPVVGDPVTLTGIRYEGGTGGIQQIGSEPFNGHSVSYSVSSDMTEDGTVSYVAFPANKNAKVTFRNKMTGFEKVGTVVDIPMQVGNNEIEIEVVYGSRSFVYAIDHEIENMKYDLFLSVGTTYDVNSLTATWQDKNGQTKSYTVKKGDTYEFLEIYAGTEVTLTSTTHPGLYPFLYDEVNLVPDLTKPGYPATFVFKGDIGVYLYNTEMMAYPPEGLSAKWQRTDDSALVEVKALQIPEFYPTTYEKICVEVVDGKGEVVATSTIGGSTMMPEEDGYYRVQFFDLDCTKEYKINAYYEDLYNKNESKEKQTASFTLEKRKPVTLSAKSEYVVLKPGETVDVPIIYEGYAGSMVVVEDGYDTAVVSYTGTQIKSDVDGNRSLQITAAEEGTTYLTLRGDDYENSDGMQYVFATVRVDVSSVDEAPALNLGVKKGTLNLYDDSALTIPVYQMECGHDIEGAQFANADLNDKFTIEVVDDRTLKVVPKVPEDDGTVDFSKWVKTEGLTGTFSSKIVVNYNGAASRESTENLKITLTVKKPQVKVSALSFNSFYTTQTKNLQVTVKGEKVDKVQIDTAKANGTTVACPTWLSLKEADKSVTFDGKTVPANKTSAYLYLKVWPEGYRLPVQTKVKVNVAYTTPKLKFKKSTITTIKDMADNSDLEVQLVSGDKKVKYQNIGVQSVSMMSYMDYMKLSAKNRKNHVSPEVFEDYYAFDKESGTISFTCAKVPTSGKVVFYANVANGKKPVQVSFKLKVQASPTIKLNKKTVTMDAIFGTYPMDDMKFVKISSNAPDYRINSSNLKFKVTMVGDKTQTDYGSHFSMGWDTDAEAIRIMRNSAAQAGKTYKVTVSVDGIKKTASFNIKVIKSARPAFKVSKTEVTLNRLQNDGTAPITISLPKKYGTGWYTTELEMIRPDGIKDNGSLTYSLTDKDKVCFKATTSTVKGTYIVKINGGMYGNGYNSEDKDAAVKHAEIKVKVVDKFPNMSAKPATVTLNKDLAGYDKATVTLPKPDKYKYGASKPWSLTSIVGADGKDASDSLICNLKDNTVTIASNDLTKYNTTYKLTFTCKFFYDLEKQTTVTVKIPKKTAAISISGKASGSIDTTRPNTTKATITYTYTNWNEANYESENVPVLEWEVYAKNGKKAVTTASGALNDNGLVAKGSSLSAVAQDGSWFENTGYTADTPYKLAFMIDMDSAAWEEENISPAYTYTVKATLKFSDTDTVINAKPVTFKVKQGTTKFSLNKKTVSLNKLDAKGRALITITDKDKDCLQVQDIACVEVSGNKKVPVSKAIEIVPVYQANKSVTYAIYWKDKTVSNVKSGTVKLNVYLKGNDPARKKPNATLNLKVNIK